MIPPTRLVSPPAARPEGRSVSARTVTCACTLVLLVCSVLVPIAAVADDCAQPFSVGLQLPPGERKVEKTIPLASKPPGFVATLALGDEFRSGLCIELSGKGLVRLEIEVRGRGINGVLDTLMGPTPAWATVNLDGTTMQVVSENVLVYQDVLALHESTDTDRSLEIAMTHFGIEQVTSSIVAEMEMRLSMERLAPQCVMAAHVTGDVSGHFFGDVAYFNAREEAVAEGGMAGTLADEGMHAQMQNFMGMMGGFAAMAEERGLETGLTPEQKLQLGLHADGTPIETDESGEAALTPAQRATAEGLEESLKPKEGEPGDNFGLSLTDARMRSASDLEQYAPGQAMSGAFTLTVSGSATDDLYGPQQKGPKLINVSSGHVAMTAGMSDRRGAIKFELEEDAELEFTVQAVTPALIWGTLTADLETRSVYSESSDVIVNDGPTGGGIVASEKPRKLKASVTARFFAGRGFMSCMGQ